MMEIPGGSHGMALTPRSRMEIWQRMDDFPPPPRHARVEPEQKALE
jgi:hypothetical protein